MIALKGPPPVVTLLALPNEGHKLIFPVKIQSPHSQVPNAASSLTMSLSAAQITLQPAHGYIPLLIAGSGLVVYWAAFKVGAARRKYKIPYPQMYADKDSKNANEFNCVQRAHQNVLENIPVFYALLATSAYVSRVYRPTIAAAAGAVRILGFIVYVKGYTTGDAKKRLRGNFGTFTAFFIGPPLNW
ncbi:hypothetical protein BBJ28_00003737 [Nothophytophthora sp. Chile5]|nr:hypothetical protein BBJ28_00003737 [Nothophytophthora sp. Chile5]